jgi:cobalamin-dependent methionine synthase I
MDMGIVNAGQLGVYEEIPPICSSASRTSCSTAARRHRADGRVRRDGARRGQEARDRPRLARGARSSSASRTRSCTAIVDFIEADTEEARSSSPRRST